MERHHLGRTRAKGIPIGGLARFAGVLALGLSAIPGVLAEQIVWDGGGGDDLWSTRLNWSGNQLPGPIDDIHFDATSSKPCRIDVGGPVNNLTVHPGYGGTLSFDQARPPAIFSINANFLQLGGTVDWSLGAEPPIVRLRGNYTHLAGASLGGNLEFLFTGQNRLVAGPGGLEIEDLRVQADSLSSTLDVDGDLAMEGLFVFSDGESATTVNLNVSQFTVSERVELSNATSTLNIQDGVTLDARGALELINNGIINELGTGRILFTASRLEIIDQEQIPAAKGPGPGGTFIITLTDRDENADGTSEETAIVAVTTAATGDTELIVLNETAFNSGEFQNPAPLPVMFGFPNSGDGIVQYDGSENILVTYIDENDTDDVLTALLRPSLVSFWDGGGPDDFWTTPENWSGDQTPGLLNNPDSLADVHFDATSSKPCVINIPLMVHHFTVASGYGGVITFEGEGPLPLTVLGDFNQEVGTIDWITRGDGSLRLLGDYTRSGGVSIGGTFTFAGPGIQNFDPGLGLMFVNQVLIDGPGSQVLNIDGNLRLDRFMRNETSGQPGTVNLLGGVMTVNQSFGIFFPGITLNVLDGAVLDARAAAQFANDGVINEIGTGKVLRDALSIQFTDSVGNVVDSVVEADIFVTVVDQDENSNGTVPDTVLVEVFDVVNGDREMLVLDETGPSSGEFRNMVGLPTTFGTMAVPFDGLFLHDGSNNIFATYVDEQVSEDELLGKLFPDFIWGETGPDTNWENGGNWNLNQTPDLNANVVFGNLNSRPCVVNVPQRLANFTMEPHYRGVLNIEPGGGFIVGQPPATGGPGAGPGQDPTGSTQSGFVFHQRGGTIVWGGVTELWGDLIRTGGVTLGAGDFIMQGQGLRSFVAGPLGMQVQSISVRSDDACLVGDISVLNLLDIASVATTKIIGETRMVSGDLIISPQSNLFIQNGSVLDARDANLFQNMGRIEQVGTGRVLRDASFLAPVDVEGTPLNDILPGDPLFVRLVDEDENEDGNLIDHASVRVSNLTNGDVETILLEETDPLSGTFHNPQPIPTLPEPPVPGNGQLEGQPGDRFEILYIDDEDPKDILAFVPGTPRIFITPRILTFGARDVNAINQANRSGKGLSSFNQKVVRIRNDGTEDLVFDPLSVNFTGPDSDSFSISGEIRFRQGIKGAALGDLQPLASGESLGLVVAFDPFEAGIKRAGMVISSNDPNEPEARVAMGGLAQVRPHVTSVVYRDVDQDFLVSPGDTLTVVWDQAVFIKPELLNQASFFLPFDTDGLGNVGFSVEQKPTNDRQTIITLGGNASLFFSPFGDGKTPLPDFGLDIDANLPFGAVLNRFGLPAVDSGIPGVNDTAVPITVPFIQAAQSIPFDSGGEIRVEDAPFVSYTKHSLVIPPGSRANQKGGADDVVITLGPPTIETGEPQAIQIESSVSGLTFDPPAILTLEYLPSDWDRERGQTEGSMILCQLVETEDDVFGWAVVPGMQDIDTDPNVVKVLIHSLDPVGDLKGKSSLKDNGGSVGIFANLPGETIKPTTFRMSPSQSPGAKVIIKGDAAVITLDPEGSIYAESSLEIPGYELTDETDPDRIELTLRSAQLLEKLSISGGTSFPSTSNALLVVETSDAAALPVEFTDPVNFNVQFMDGTGEGLEDFFDLFDFDNQQQAAIAMRLARDMEDEFDVDFGYVTDLEQLVDLIDGGGRVQITGITNLTGPSGQATWGAVANPDAVENNAGYWELFE